jgi:hypothetical protein
MQPIISPFTIMNRASAKPCHALPVGVGAMVQRCNEHPEIGCNQTNTLHLVTPGNAINYFTFPGVALQAEPTRKLASYVHFFPRPFFHANPPNKATDYFTTWLNYQF